jgi:hypothetical protein
LRSCSDLGSDMRFPFSLTTSKALCGVCEPQAPTQTTACGRTGFQPHPRRQRFLSCASPRWRIDATPDVSDIPLERPIGRNSPARWPTKCRSGQKRTSAPSNIRSGIDLEASLRRGGPMASINLQSLTCAGSRSRVWPISMNFYTGHACHMRSTRRVSIEIFASLVAFASPSKTKSI